MANEKRLIDADALISEFEWLKSVVNESSKDEIQETIQRIENAPTVDAVILPCKLGTTLYRICEEHLGRKPFIRVVTFNRTNFTRIVLDNEVGRTVFLTREEAEAQLAKMKEGADND